MKSAISLILHGIVVLLPARQVFLASETENIIFIIARGRMHKSGISKLF